MLLFGVFRTGPRTGGPLAGGVDSKVPVFYQRDAIDPRFWAQLNFDIKCVCEQGLYTCSLRGL